MLDSYDVVRYASFPRRQTHPAYIAALAKIAGLDLPDIEQWRVLEIGCGNGINILPFAFDYPQGEFIGVDRAKETLENGRSLAADLKLNNLRLHAEDLLEWKPEGEFDYIIAHGVFSWVPPEVRERILQICRISLKPLGIAFISYNTLPGCYFRQYARDLLRFHARGVDDPASRVERAVEIARLIVDGNGKEPTQSAIRKEMENMLERDVSSIYHDDLSEVNEPFYLLDFVRHAARYGLEYLWDAQPQRDSIHGQPKLAEDWLEARQYGDFLERRRFRETLLCRKGIEPDRKLSLDRFLELTASSRAIPGEIKENGEQSFSLPYSQSITTNHPLAKSLLNRLSGIWPQSIPVSELAFGEFSEEVTADILMRLLQAEAIDLRTSPPKIAESIGECPVASALVRAQLARGDRLVANQRHQGVDLEDEISHRLLMLMDGSRDRAELAREITALRPGQEPAALETGLLNFHRLNLLTG